MALSHSPAVSFPQVRSKKLAGVLMGFAWLQWLVLAAWLYEGAGVGGQWGLRAALAAAAGGLACGLCGCIWHMWPQGLLRYEQGIWYWCGGGASASVDGRVTVLMDLQRHMLLKWQPQQGQVLHLWLSMKYAPQDWGDLRRAVYSSTHRWHASSAAQQPMDLH